MMKKKNKMYKLYLKYKDEKDYRFYGIRSMYYMRELILDYLVVHDMYNEDQVEFKIERCKDNKEE